MRKTLSVLLAATALLVAANVGSTSNDPLASSTVAQDSPFANCRKVSIGTPIVHLWHEGTPPPPDYISYRDALDCDGVIWEINGSNGMHRVEYVGP